MRASHLFRALTPHWERRHLAGVFDSVHAGKMPALPVLRKNVRCALEGGSENIPLARGASVVRFAAILSQREPGLGGKHGFRATPSNRTRENI